MTQIPLLTTEGDAYACGLAHGRRFAREIADNLATLLQATDRLGEAEPLMRRALAIREKSLGADHPDVASSLNNLAQLLQDTNRLAEAEPLMRRALDIDEKSYGPDHPEVATRLNNLAVVYKNQNRYAEAEPLYERALALGEKSLGADHPDRGLQVRVVEDEGPALAAELEQ